MKTLKLTIFIVFISLNFINAQQQLNHEKKVYVDKNSGKLFWNKSLPFYIRLSTSPDEDAETYLMHSESTAEFADPAYFDTEGINYIRTQWAVDKDSKEAVYPQKEVVWEVYRDGTPPNTKFDLINPHKIIRNGKIYCKGKVSLDFRSEDALSGVEKIYYSIEKEDYRVFDQPFDLKAEKEYFIQYYAVDHVGNVEATNEKTIVIDNSPPVSKYEFDGEVFENIISSGTKISLSASDNLSGTKTIFYQIDSLGEEKFIQPLHVNQLSEGEHTITFYAKDSLDNEENKQKFQIFIDNTPPVVISDLLGDSFITNGKEYSSGRSRVKLTAIDNKSGIKKIYYSVNGGEYKEYNKPFFLPGKQGDYKIDYYAVDNVGNKSNSSLGKQKDFATPYLDLTAPSLSYDFEGPQFQFRDTLYICRKTKINFLANDDESGIKNIKYKINDGEEMIFKDPFRIERPGFHQVEFAGIDNVNNSNRQKFNIMIDNQGPSVFPVLSMNPIHKKKINNESIPVYGDHMILYLAGTDDITGVQDIYYTINDNREEIYNSPITGFKNGEKYIITIKSIDKLGNEEYKNLKFFIE